MRRTAKAYLEGYNAYKTVGPNADGSTAENPYYAEGVQAKKHDDWFAGWFDAQAESRAS